MNREKIIQIAEELSYSHGGTSASLSFENLVKFWDIAQREAVWAAADCQLARSCDRHGYDKYGDGDAIREMAKLREQERDDFESDVDTLAQHNVQRWHWQISMSRLRS